MGGDYHLQALGLRLAAAKERLTLERANILQLYPGRKYQNRAAYGFAYIRAERLCIDAIKRRMNEVSWLPARLDTSSDINSATRDQMARWIRQGEGIVPGEEVFGNAFVHVLARCSLIDTDHGETTQKLVDRVALLFRDLTCLVAAIHCCHILQEFEVERVKLTLPQDITRIALDLTIMTETLLAMQDEDESDDGPDFPVSVGNENKKLPPDYLRLVTEPSEQPGA